MHSSNRRCNAFQSAVGVFLQSCNAPETLRELLAHMGVSVATTSINSAIKSLSKQVDIAIRHLGQSLLVSYAYDNLDIDLKHSVPTAENPQETLAHLSTMTMLPYHPSIKLENLSYSQELMPTQPECPRHSICIIWSALFNISRGASPIRSNSTSALWSMEISCRSHWVWTAVLPQI